MLSIFLAKLCRSLLPECKLNIVSILSQDQMSPCSICLHCMNFNYPGVLFLMGSPPNKFQWRHIQKEFLFLREKSNISIYKMVNVQEWNQDISSRYLLYQPSVPQNLKPKPTWNWPWHLVCQKQEFQAHMTTTHTVCGDFSTNP